MYSGSVQCAWYSIQYLYVVQSCHVVHTCIYCVASWWISIKVRLQCRNPSHAHPCCIAVAVQQSIGLCNSPKGTHGRTCPCQLPMRCLCKLVHQTLPPHRGAWQSSCVLLCNLATDGRAFGAKLDKAPTSSLFHVRGRATVDDVALASPPRHVRCQAPPWPSTRSL